MATFYLGANGISSSNCRQNPLFSSGLSSSRLPSFVNVKKIRNFGSKRRICGRICAVAKGDSDNRSVGGGGGLLEKELEFKPAFDEYLKALEAAKVVKEQKKEKKSFKMKREKNVNFSKENSSEVVEKSNEFDGHGGGDTGKFDGIMKDENYEALLDTGARFFEREMGSFKSDEENGGFESRRKSRDRRVYGNGIVRRNEKLPREMDNEGLLDKGRRFSEGEEDSFGSVKKNGMLKSMGRARDREGYDDGSVQRNEKSARDRKGMIDVYEDIDRPALKSFEQLYDIMDKPPVSKREMEDRIQRLAKSLNGADINMPEWMFSKMMRSAKIRFSDHSMVRLMQILGKYGNWKRALQLIEWLQSRERFKSHKLRYIYTAALNVLKKARRPVEALNLFYTMQEKMSSYPDIVAYRCIAVTLGQAGHMKELFDVIDSMRSPPKKKLKTGALDKWDPRLEPDIVVYNAVLNACVQRKQLEGAFWVLQQIRQQGLELSAATYGLVMEVMFACGKYNLVHEFFQKVRKSSIPNALTYKVLVNTLWKEGRTDEALLAVQDMERRGIVGSAALYYDIARCLCSTGRCQEALTQVEKICKVANKPLVVAYTGLIQACLDSGNIQDAADIFNKMHKFCSPNLVTCNIMIKAYLDHGMFEEAKSMLQRMLEDGIRISNVSDYKVYVLPDTYTFNTMLEACSANQRWEDFETIYKRMLQHGFHFNPKRHLKMMLDASRAGKGELVETTWEHLTQGDQIPPPALVKERFCMKLEKGEYSAALSCISSHPASDSSSFSKRAWLSLFKENSSRFQNDTLDQLIYEIGSVIARSDPPNPVFVDLLASCREFFRIRTTMIESIPRSPCTI